MIQGGIKSSFGSRFRSFWGQEFFRSGLIHWVLIGTLFVALGNWAAVGYFIRPVDFMLILHYNVYFGVDILGSWGEIYLLPGIGTLFALINAFLAFFSYQRKERIAAYLFLLGGFLVQAGTAIAIATIIKINF